MEENQELVDEGKYLMIFYKISEILRARSLVDRYV